MKLNNLTKAGIVVAGYGAGQAIYNTVKGLKIRKDITKEDLVKKDVVIDATKAALNGIAGVVIMATGATIIKEGLEGKQEMLGVVVLKEDDIMDDILDEEIEDNLDDEELLEDTEELELKEAN